MSANYISAALYYYWGYGASHLDHYMPSIDFKEKTEDINNLLTESKKDEALGRSTAQFHHAISTYYYPQRSKDKVENEIAILMKK